MKRITVLLADDNGVVRKEFKKILELEDDLDVVGEAKNGRQAVAMVKKLRPALVLMDIAMPLLNGLQATRQILKAAAATTKLAEHVAQAVQSEGEHLNFEFDRLFQPRFDDVPFVVVRHFQMQTNALHEQGHHLRNIKAAASTAASTGKIGVVAPAEAAAAVARAAAAIATTHLRQDNDAGKGQSESDTANDQELIKFLHKYL